MRDFGGIKFAVTAWAKHSMLERERGSFDLENLSLHSSDIKETE
jgi:hypothetical protein